MDWLEMADLMDARTSQTQDYSFSRYAPAAAAGVHYLCRSDQRTSVTQPKKVCRPQRVGEGKGEGRGRDMRDRIKCEVFCAWQHPVRSLSISFISGFLSLACPCCCPCFCRGLSCTYPCKKITSTGTQRLWWRWD